MVPRQRPNWRKVLDKVLLHLSCRKEQGEVIVVHCWMVVVEIQWCEVIRSRWCNSNIDVSHTKTSLCPTRVMISWVNLLCFWMCWSKQEHWSLRHLTFPDNVWAQEWEENLYSDTNLVHSAHFHPFSKCTLNAFHIHTQNGWPPPAYWTPWLVVVVEGPKVHLMVFCATHFEHEVRLNQI